MTDRDLLNKKFGNPADDAPAFERNNLVVFKCQKLFPSLPFQRMYVHYLLVSPLINTFTLLEKDDLLQELKTFDGCWSVRNIRGYNHILSIHSWALAVDFNAKDNPLGYSREKAIEIGLTPFTEAFQDVWRKSGWVCGIDFNRKDGMHYQWTKWISG